MNKKEKIQKEIDKTLSLFDKKESLPPNPYFYTRVKQRLNEKPRKEFSFSALLKPAFFTVLVALNLTTAIWYTSSSDIVIQSNSNESLVEIFSSDFNLDSDDSNLLIVE